jgi:hypothetical protein
MPDQNDQAGAKQKTKSRRLLNPRRVQSLLKRAQETMLADSRDPKLTAQERIALLKVASEYVRALAVAEGRRRTEDRAKRAADKKAELAASKSKTIFDD